MSHKKDLAAVDGRRFNVDGILTAVSVVLLLFILLDGWQLLFSSLASGFM